MASSRFAFTLLLKNVNPSDDRVSAAQELPGAVREWLKEHEFQTRSPHSRLIGSYARQTAITDIKDVDALLFLPDEALARSPESVLRDLKQVLDDYPDASAEAAPQRRSIRLDFPSRGLCLDIVAAVADEGTGAPLRIPDRRKREWIKSDPLGYGRSLSAANDRTSGRLVPLIKLIKAWRDQQMTIKRPKSYLLEVIVYHAVDSGAVVLSGHSTAQNVHDLFHHLALKWEKLFHEGEGVPRVLDPQLNTIISADWERSHFETFMRRLEEAVKASSAALEALDEGDASTEWQKVFGDLWPSAAEIEAEARAAAQLATPGVARVSATGKVTSTAAATSFVTRPTTFHGRGAI